MEAPVRRVPRITPEMKLDAKFAAAATEIETLLEPEDAPAARACERESHNGNQ